MCHNIQGPAGQTRYKPTQLVRAVRAGRPHLFEKQRVERVPHKRIASIKCAIDVDSFRRDDTLKVDWALDRHVLPRWLAHVPLKHLPTVGLSLRAIGASGP
jgi:hypothetical protein